MILQPLYTVRVSFVLDIERFSFDYVHIDNTGLCLQLNMIKRSLVFALFVISLARNNVHVAPCSDQGCSGCSVFSFGKPVTVPTETTVISRIGTNKANPESNQLLYRQKLH